MNWNYRQLFWLLTLCPFVFAYEVPITDTDYSPEICSGMWGGSNTHINVTFDETSQGQLAMVIYEWKDNAMLGKVTSMTDNSLPKTYICTSDAVRGGFCSSDQLGRFILDLPSGTSINDTSFWLARIAFQSSMNAEDPTNTEMDNDTMSGRLSPKDLPAQARDNPSPSDILVYDEPIYYEVRKTGYYCVGIVPVTVLSNKKRQASTDVPYHPSYKGSVLFRNTFDGMLPAADYPKVNFYFALFIVYAALGGGWGWLCYKHKEDLLPIQYYLSGLVGFVVIEMVANWAYYRYLNAHGKSFSSTVFLFVVAIFDAGRNALSFFMLLVVSLGLSVVRESLGSTMIKCLTLAAAHFVFGVLYAVGIVELELETTSALVLLLFVIPLAFTLSGFLLWIMYALNGTMTELAARKQRYKLTMFKRLYRVLLVAVIIIALFFVMSSLSFSNRLAEDYAANSWQVRWWLLDAMSDELAQEDEDAEDYDLEALESRDRAREDDDNATLVGPRNTDAVSEDAVVFEIGDQDLSDDEDNKTKPLRHEASKDSPNNHDESTERHGLMGSYDEIDKDV